MAEKEYIEREAAIKTVTWWYEKACRPENMSRYNMGERDAYTTAISEITEIHAADVRPVVRGKWKLDSDPGEPWRYVCNICGEKTKDTVMGKPRENYCPNCGADMRELLDKLRETEEET